MSSTNDIKKEKALVVIPAFNEERTIAAIVGQIPEEVAGVAVHVLVINDGSTDLTGPVVERSRGTVLHNAERRGKGAAVQTGFAHALREGYRFVVSLDGDAQHDPRYVATIIKILKRGGVDLVTSSRYLRQMDAVSKPPLERKLVNVMMTGAVNRLTGLRLTDAFCGVFGARTDFFADKPLTTKDYGIVLELILRTHFSGGAILEIPHPLIYYREGNSKFREVYGMENHLGARLEQYTKVILDTLADLKVEDF